MWAKQAEEQAILLATIGIGFGMMANADACKGQPHGTCTGGLGTVVGDRYTIYTAWHTYANAQGGNPDWFYYRDRAGKPYSILLEPDMIEHTDGTDVLIIHLPKALDPKQFVPAKIAHPTFHGGEDVSVAYRNDDGALNILRTQIRTNNTYLPGGYGAHGISVYNPNDLTVDPNQNYQYALNEGDSGGGVFYNGYFVGVSGRVGSNSGPYSYMVFEQP